MFGDYMWQPEPSLPPGQFKCTTCSTHVVFASDPSIYSLSTKDQLSKKLCSRCYYHKPSPTGATGL